MLKSFVLSIVLVFLQLSTANAAASETKNVEFPSCEEVMSFVIYTLEHLPSENLALGLAKKEDGYFITVSKYEKPNWDILQYIPVWTAENEEYVIPELGKYQGDESDRNSLQSHFTTIFNDFANYDFYKYRGYPECDQDIIDHFKTHTDFTTYEYELLARAHSNLAGRYFHPHIGGVPPAFVKDFTLSNYAKIAPSRVQNGWKQIEKAFEYWYRIEEVDPNYEPHIISNIHLKIANEHMHFWTFLMSVKEPELAQKLLDRVDYLPVDLEVAKRMLDNCEKNSFLITNGDSDTFPVQYVQEKLNYRKDVRMMNASLMQTAWYLTMCKARGNYQTSYTSEDYDRLNTFVVVPYTEGEMSVESVLKDSVLNVSSESFKRGYTLVPSSLTVDIRQDESTTLVIRDYLYMWQLALIDMIISNPDSKFLTTSPTSVWRDIGMKKHGVSRGSLSFLALGRGGDFMNKTINYFSCFQDQFDNMDVSQMNDSYLTRYEYENFVSNLSQSRFIFLEAMEKVGEELIKEIDLDIVASVDEPHLVFETIRLYETFDHENAAILREKYRTKALEIIASLDDSGDNFLAKQRAAIDIFRIYSGKSYYSSSTTDTYEETDEDKAVLNELFDKLKMIQSNISIETRYRTSRRINYLVDQF